MQGTKIREEQTRLFVTLYKGRRRLVTKTVWYLNSGGKKHELSLTDYNGRVFIKHWSWFETPDGKIEPLKFLSGN